MKLCSLYRAALLLIVSPSLLSAQNYQGYGDDDQGYDQGYYQQEGDTLYQDYAQHQEMKAMGGGGGGGMVKTVAFSAVSWFLGGKIHSKRAVKKAETKAKKELKQLYANYVKDVKTLQTQIAELENYIRQSTKQQLTEEFLQADLDNNRQVSRAEFELHKKQYLAKHPEFDARQYPDFEDFDPDGNGMITVAEHEYYYKKRDLI